MNTIVVWINGSPWACGKVHVLLANGREEDRWVAERPLTGEEIDHVQRGEEIEDSGDE